MIKRRIDDAAERLKSTLGARDVLVVAWFNDIVEPGYLHSQDGGTAPMPISKVYHYLAATVDQMMSGTAQPHREEIKEEIDLLLPGEEPKDPTVQ